MNQKTGSIVGLTVSASRYNETSAVVTLATEENGLVSFLCNRIYDAKSPLKPMLIIGSTLEVFYSERGTSGYTARQVRVVYDGSPLYLSYVKTCFLLLMQELCGKFFDFGDSFPVKEAQSIVSALANDKDPLSLSLLLMGSLYRSLGISIDTAECVICHKKENIVSYDLEMGGLLCDDCAKGKSVPVRDNMTLHVMRYAFMKPEEKNLSKKVPEANGERVLRELCSYLSSYFDAKEIKCLLPFIEACRSL